MNGQFNAIDYAQQLEAAGVPQAQAEVHAKMLALAVVSCSASRADLAALGEKLNCRIEAVKQELTNSIDLVRQDLTSGIDLVRQELTISIDLVRQDLTSSIDLVRQELTSRIELVKQELSSRIDALEQKFDSRFDALEQEIRYVKRHFYWMFAIHTSMIIAILVKLYSP